MPNDSLFKVWIVLETSKRLCLGEQNNVMSIVTLTSENLLGMLVSRCDEVICNILFLQQMSFKISSSPNYLVLLL